MGSASFSSCSQGSLVFHKGFPLLHAFAAWALRVMCLYLDSAELATKLGHSQAFLGCFSRAAEFEPWPV